MTKMNCGLTADKSSQHEKPPAVMKMVSQREVWFKIQDQ